MQIERETRGQEEEVLDQTTEQMATQQRENHNGDITTLRLKSPLEDTHRLSCKGQSLSIYYQCLKEAQKVSDWVPGMPASLELNSVKL